MQVFLLSYIDSTETLLRLSKLSEKRLELPDKQPYHMHVHLERNSWDYNWIYSQTNMHSLFLFVSVEQKTECLCLIILKN